MAISFHSTSLQTDDAGGRAPGIHFDTALGLACLEAYVLCSITNQLGEFSGIHFFEYRSYLICWVVAILLMVSLVLWKSKAARIMLCSSGVLLTAAWIVDSCALVWFEQAAGSELALLLFSTGCKVSSMIFTVQWSLFIAISDERNIVPTISLAMIGATLIYILICLVGGPFALVAVGVLLALSGTLLLRKTMASSEPPVQNEAASSEGDSRQGRRRLMRIRAGFFASRLMWALFFASFFIALSVYDPPSNNGPLSVVVVSLVLVLLCGIIVRLVKNGSFPVETAAFLPVVIAIALLFCFYSDGPNSYIRTFAAVCHICWFTQLYYQTPTYYRLLKMDSVVFSYSERILSFLLFECIMWTALSVPEVLDAARSITPELLAACVLVFMVVSMAIATRHFVGYYPGTQRIAPKQRSEALGNPASAPYEGGPLDSRGTSLEELRGFAKHHYLTPRETDVFLLLAQGYSRPYIEKKLFISEGTARTHIRSIYQKLGVNSKNELIAQVSKHLEL